MLTTINGNIHTEFGCEGSTVFLSCSYGYYISIVRANYGRFSILVCNVHSREWDTDCGTEIRSTEMLRKM